MSITQLKKIMQQGKWISRQGQFVQEEPPFSLADMFAGKKPVFVSPEKRLLPPQCFHRFFSLQEQEIVAATLYATAHGVYHAYINGEKVSDTLFAPDFTAYDKYLQVQVYDVAPLLHSGENNLGIIVADGWYAGRISVMGGSAQFGNRLAALLVLEVELSDGTLFTVASDECFTAGRGRYEYADIQIGEKQDWRQNRDWFKYGFTEHAEVVEGDYQVLRPQLGEPVKKLQYLKAQKIWREDEAYIVDFGQVIAGRVQLTAAIPEGRVVTLEHTEVLNEAGKFFVNIIGRNKEQQDVFIGDGQQHMLEPEFTFHGFRYVRITGLSQLPPTAIRAVVIGTALAETGYLRTDNPQINRLLQNIEWSLKGNTVSIPTDCPQRERMGWTGDMQIFAPTACFFRNMEDFARRWLCSVRCDQQDNGEIIDYSPAPRDFYASTEFTGTVSSAGWGDAIIMVPWVLYVRYGHKQVLAENFSAMQKWLDFAQKSAAGKKKGLKKYIWDTKFHYGDWMFPSFMLKEPNPMKTAIATKDLVATAFLAHSAELMAKICKVLGRDGRQAQAYAQKVKMAFRQVFVNEQGRLRADYQGCYVLTLAFAMVTGEQGKLLARRLVELIQENGMRLDTGFLSVPYLLDVLCDYGYADVAKKIFLQNQCPSWLYEVEHGATTIWESWAGITPEGKVGPFSFNHYAFGCVGDWLVRRMAGLEVVEPGYRKFRVAPEVDLCNSWELCYRTAFGKIHLRSECKADYRILKVSVPEGTEAEISVPGQGDCHVIAGEYKFVWLRQERQIS